MATNNAADIKTAALGKIFQGQGVGTPSDYSTATYPASSGGTGKILYDNGTNFVESTPTFPASASATTRKIIVSDGTNWNASTETWAVPGSNGNVLTSDGTNWTSAAAAGGGLGYVIFWNSGTNSNPVASSTYFATLGQSIIANVISSGATRIFIPKAGTVKIAYGTFTVGGTLASAHNTTLNIRLNNTTDTAISSTIQLTSADSTFNNTGLSISVVAGDYLDLKWVTGAWTTAPTNVRMACSLSIQ